jgi:uncharacterized ParB-like nuclease family protein
MRGSVLCSFEPHASSITGIDNIEKLAKSNGKIHYFAFGCAIAQMANG